MEGVWQQTRSPDASSSETFIHTHEHARTHTPTQTHISADTSYLLSRPLLPAVRLSQKPLRIRASWEFFGSSFDYPSSISAKGRQASRTEAGPLLQKKRPPTERERGRDGTADKGESGDRRALSSTDRFPSLTSLSPCLPPRSGTCRLFLCACCLLPADSWPGNPFQESQVEFCVKQRSIIWRPD